jgi:hypothetical protein
MTVELQWLGPTIDIVFALVIIASLYFSRERIASMWRSFGLKGGEYVPRVMMAVIAAFAVWSVYTTAGTYGPKLSINQPRSAQYERGGEVKDHEPPAIYEGRFNERVDGHLDRLAPGGEPE